MIPERRRRFFPAGKGRDAQGQPAQDDHAGQAETSAWHKRRQRVPEKPPVRRQQISHQPCPAHRRQPRQRQQSEGGAKFPQQIIAPRHGFGGVDDDGVAGQVPRNEERQATPSAKMLNGARSDAEEIEQHVLRRADRDFRVLHQPRCQHRRHGKFLERCKWLNGSGLVDKAGHCAQSFSRLGHVKTISKRAIEDGALVGRSTSPSAGQSPGQGARPSASGPASLFGRCSRGGRATLVCSD